MTLAQRPFPLCHHSSSKADCFHPPCPGKQSIGWVTSLANLAAFSSLWEDTPNRRKFASNARPSSSIEKCSESFRPISEQVAHNLPLCYTLTLPRLYVAPCELYHLCTGSCSLTGAPQIKSKDRNVILKDNLFLVDCHLLFSSHPPLLISPAY